MYDAMAEGEKTEAVDSKLESDVKGNTEVDQENGAAKFPGKHDLNGSEASTDSPVSVKENGVEKSPCAPVASLGESLTTSPVKEAVMEKVKAQNEEKAGGKDEESEPEAEQDTDEPEGSRSLHTEHG